MHMNVEQRIEKDSQCLIPPIVMLYSSSYFVARSEARLFYFMVAVYPRSLVLDITNRVKEACSASLTC